MHLFPVERPCHDTHLVVLPYLKVVPVLVVVHISRFHNIRQFTDKRNNIHIGIGLKPPLDDVLEAQAVIPVEQVNVPDIVPMERSFYVAFTIEEQGERGILPRSAFDFRPA